VKPARSFVAAGGNGVVDCRVSQLPSLDLVVDYFRWRNEDAHRNALNAHCYWLLRKQGKGVAEGTAALKACPSPQERVLFQHGVNFNDLPLWQKRGVGFYWEEFDRPAENPVTGEKVLARRRRIRRDLELPMKDDYSASCESSSSRESSRLRPSTIAFFWRHPCRPLKFNKVKRLFGFHRWSCCF